PRAAGGLGTALRTARGERGPALAAEPVPRRIVDSATGAPHGRDSTLPGISDMDQPCPVSWPRTSGPEAVTGEPRLEGGFLTFLDRVLGRRALVVEADHGSVRPSQGRDDEAHPGKELPEVMLNLGDHPPRPIPGRGLILEAPVADERGVARAAAGPGP